DPILIINPANRHRFEPCKIGARFSVFIGHGQKTSLRQLVPLIDPRLRHLPGPPRALSLPTRTRAQRPVPRHPRPRAAPVSNGTLWSLCDVHTPPPAPHRRRCPAVVAIHEGSEVQVGPRGQPSHRLAGNSLRP